MNMKTDSMNAVKYKKEEKLEHVFKEDDDIILS